jgi:uncharacterized protein YdaU (DUF1376 family)
LTALELGCLHKIRNYLWIHNFQGLKNDDREIAKICHITKNKWLKVKPNLMQFLEIYDDGIIERTWRLYFNEAVKKSENARRAAMIGCEKKQAKMLAVAQQMQSKLEPEPTLEPKPNSIYTNYQERNDIDHDSLNEYIDIVKNHIWYKLDYRRPNVSPKLIAQSMYDLDVENVDTPSMPVLIEKYNAYCLEYRSTNDDMTYCKGFNKWLSDECWLDED